MQTRGNRVWVGLMVSALMLVFGGFLFVDRYDDKKSIITNVRDAKYFLWEDCSVRVPKSINYLDGDYSTVCGNATLSYRWVLLLALAMFSCGLYLRAVQKDSKPPPLPGPSDVLRP